MATDDNGILRGTVYKYDPLLQYGFLETLMRDTFFFHKKNLLTPVKPGDEVEFKIGKFNDRVCAVNVAKIQGV